MTAVDSTRCAHVLARCYVATDPGADPGLRAELAAAVDRLNAVPGRARVRDRDVLHRARYFRPPNGARIDAVREAIEAEYAGHRPVAGPAHQPAGGGRPGRLDHRAPDGLPEAVGAPGGPTLALRVPDLLAGTGPGLHGDAVPWPVRPAWATWTWPTSTRPTTSTATTPTTTCGRRWWPGTPPSTTGWPASGASSATRPPGVPSTAGGPCRRPWPRGAVGGRPRWSCCRTTTSRGSPTTS